MSLYRKFSVLIPAFNVEEYIERCLISCRELIETYDSEIVIYDDGSSDKTREIAERFKCQRVRLYSGENQGVAEARNRLIELAQGEYLIFLDADDYLLPGYAQELMSKICDGERWCTFNASFVRKNYCTLQGSDHRLLSWMEPDKRIRILNMIVTSGTCIEREIAVKTGRFDKELEPSEDWDYWIRCTRNGRLALSERILVGHQINEAGIFRKEGGGRGELYITKRKYVGIRSERERKMSEAYLTVYRIWQDVGRGEGFTDSLREAAKSLLSIYTLVAVLDLCLTRVRRVRLK